MGENSEIFERLNDVETELARLSERVTWLTRFTWLLFPSGGLVGWALSVIFGSSTP